MKSALFSPGGAPEGCVNANTLKTQAAAWSQLFWQAIPMCAVCLPLQQFAMCCQPAGNKSLACVSTDLVARLLTG